MTGPRVTADHVRALTALGPRSVLVRDAAGRLSVTTPDAAGDGAFAGRLQVLCGCGRPGRHR